MLSSELTLIVQLCLFFSPSSSFYMFFSCNSTNTLLLIRQKCLSKQNNRLAKNFEAELIANKYEIQNNPIILSSQKDHRRVHQGTSF